MQKRKLGNIEVSSIGMGCMGFSHGYGAVPSKEYALDSIRATLEFGCTFFDTAEIYGKEMFYIGHNEELVGEALEHKRQGVVLATKFHLNDDELDKPLLEVIKRHLQDSLKRLKTDYIDVYYWHRVNEKTTFEGDDVRKFVPQLSKENMKANKPILECLESFVKLKNASLAQIALAWMLKKYPHVVPIPGSKNKERILENLGAWNVYLSDEEFKALEKGLDSCKIHGHRGIEETQQNGFGKNWEKNK